MSSDEGEDMNEIVQFLRDNFDPDHIEAGGTFGFWIVDADGIIVASAEQYQLMIGTEERSEEIGRYDTLDEVKQKILEDLDQFV